ncbi:hypothetical protein [Vreelandella profundi]|uniref:hypothetical protein n=1 Tax=Vreelandella profundi TaxID=2852117 RepID=UPI001EEFE375|nr:hypothetical protein [Halomonas profundi]
MHTFIHNLTQRLIHSQIYPIQAQLREYDAVLDNDVCQLMIWQAGWGSIYDATQSSAL